LHCAFNSEEILCSWSRDSDQKQKRKKVEARKSKLDRPKGAKTTPPFNPCTRRIEQMQKCVSAMEEQSTKSKANSFASSVTNSRIARDTGTL
uniref:G protein gamma domain-containing protein n=1 Tax=Ascaris lumbricoides TaxID=6252 RepID=A0A0M3I413_ASCLU